MVRKFLYAFLLFCCFMYPAFAENDSFFTAKDLLSGCKSVVAPSFSPDGRMIVFSAFNCNFDENRFCSNLWVCRSDGSDLKQYTISDSELNHSPVWSNDGRKIAFLSTRKGGSQLWLMDIDGGEPVKITDMPRGISGFKWSKDNKSFLLLSRVDRNEAGNKAGGDKKLKVRVNSYEQLYYKVNSRVHLFLMNLSDRKITKITPEAERDLFLYANTLSPDGKEVCCIMGKNPSTDSTAELLTFSTDGSGKKTLHAKAAAFGSKAEYSPDARYIAYTKWADRSVYGGVLMLYDRNTNTVKNLTDGFKYPVSSFFWSPDSKYIYFPVEKGTKTDLFRYVAASGKIEAVVDGFYADEFSISKDGRKIAFVKSADNTPEELFVMDSDGKNIKKITSVNQKITVSKKMLPAEHFVFKGSGKTDVEGFIVRPPDFDPSKKYPAVLQIHGGPYARWNDSFEKHVLLNSQTYASKGYVIIKINPRGSIGYGKKFTDEIILDWGGKPYEDLMLGIDYVIDKYPFIDEKKIAVAGGSYGGYMVNWIVGHTDRFVCAITQCGIYELNSFYGTTSPLWLVELMFGGTPWTSRDQYEKWSPHNHAQKIKTPVLVIHGELDSVTTIDQGIQMFTALQKQGVPSKFVVLKDDEHFFPLPQSMMVVFDESIQWLDQWCKPNPESAGGKD